MVFLTVLALTVVILVLSIAGAMAYRHGRFAPPRTDLPADALLDAMAARTSLAEFARRTEAYRDQRVRWECRAVGRASRDDNGEWVLGVYPVRNDGGPERTPLTAWFGSFAGRELERIAPGEQVVLDATIAIRDDFVALAGARLVREPGRPAGGGGRRVVSPGAPADDR